MADTAHDELFLGSCLCGAVTLAASGRPLAVAACHCNSCRRHTGAPVAVYADYLVERVTFSGEQPATYESSPGAFRSFCPRCGSTIAFHGANKPDEIHLHVGLFDRAAELVPEENERTESRLPWIHRLAE